MKKTVKIVLFLMVLSMAIILIPNLTKAATHTVSDAQELASTIASAGDGDTININANIQLTDPIDIGDKSLTINGNGHTISRAEAWQTGRTNATLITVGGTGHTLTLKNVTLKGSEKYGVQAYNGGYLILDNVTILDCAYGGVLVNGGSLEVISLTLGQNRPEGNNGIEIGMGEDVTVTPTLIMNGEIITDETEGVINIATNDELTGFDVENKEGSEQKIYINDNQVVVTDQNNDILYTSNEVDGLDIEGTDFVPNVTITVHLMYKDVTFTVAPGTVLTKEDVMSKIDLAKLELTGYSIDGFYSDEELKTAFDFSKEITEDTAMYAKLSEVKAQEPAKDTTPKTGMGYGIEIAFVALMVSTIAIAVLKRKGF